MKRGEPDHISNEAERLLNSPAVKELQDRMMDRVGNKLRAVDLSDVEACRGAVAMFQATAATWSMMRQMVHERDARERSVEVV